MKIAVVTDSNSGITQKEAQELGIFVLPMPFYIDGTDYLEDITLSQEEFYQRLTNDADISTSQPSPASIMELWDKVLEQYDVLLHIPMTSGLSGSCQTAVMLSQEDAYEGRVFVVDNKKISIVQRQAVMDACALVQKGYTPEEIKRILEDASDNTSIYIEVETLKYLRKGGRITPVAAALGTLLRIKPVLTIVRGGKLDAYTKVRTTKQGKEAMLQAIRHDLTEKFGDPEGKNCYIAVAHTNNDVQAEQFAQELREAFPQNKEVIVINPLSLSVSCHIGPGALAVATYQRLKELSE